VRSTPMSIGDRFGRLTIESELPRNRRGRRMFKCRCDCGGYRTTAQDSLVTGRTTSCGCKHQERAKTLAKTFLTSHGHYGSPEYISWQAMKARCLNENHEWFDRYSKLGICDEWVESFDRFLADVGYRPTPKHTLERIDNDKGYFPRNVRWATRTEQARNRRSSRVVVVGGESRTAVEWSEITGVPAGVIRKRLDAGFSPEEAINGYEPGRRKRRKRNG
jgi:hypothetical protein